MSNCGYLTRQEADYQLRGIAGLYVGRRIEMLQEAANSPNATEEDRKKFEKSVPRNLNELRQMCSRYYNGELIRRSY